MNIIQEKESQQDFLSWTIENILNYKVLTEKEFQELKTRYEKHESCKKVDAMIWGKNFYLLKNKENHEKEASIALLKRVNAQLELEEYKKQVNEKQQARKSLKKSLIKNKIKI